MRLTENEVNKPFVTAMPHLRAKPGVSTVMRDVLIALSPAVLVAVINFGVTGIAIMAVSVVSCVFFELMYQKLLKKRVAIADLSAVVTGILLAFCLPPGLPLWMVVVGAFVAIVVVKLLCGGIGQNFLNPALAAWAFLVLAYPGQMRDFTFGLPFDAVAGPTPLSEVLTAAPTLSDTWAILWGFGTTRGAIGEVATILIILGGIYLLVRKVITWHIPVSFIGSAALLIFIFSGDGLFAGFPHYEIFLGSIMLGAFFMATDYTTSPMTKKGQIIFGLGCGAITAIIRIWGGFPEGVAYAILMMNLLVPIIDRFTKPRVYGTVKSRKGEK